MYPLYFGILEPQRWDAWNGFQLHFDDFGF